MTKKEITDEEIEKTHYENVKKEFEDIKSTINRKSKDQTYQELCKSIKSYLFEMLKEKNFLTEEETIQKLKKFNIDKTAISATEKLLKRMIEIEYNREEYTNEELYALLTDSIMLVDEINLQRVAYHQSIRDKVLSIPKKKIESQFESDLNYVKKNYSKSGKIYQGVLIRLSEYFNHLPKDKKETHSKEYNYYCKTLPELLSLISSLESSKEDFERHQLSSSINRLFAKMDDEQKKENSEKIMSALTSCEQKIDFLLIYGYSHLSNNKVDEALDVYKVLFQNFENLDKEKKKFYQPIIIRYLNFTRALEKKK